MNKYELVCTERSKVYRIRALIPLQGVKVGDLGGRVTGKHNLSQKGTCWIGYDAQCVGEARVIGCSNLCGRAIVSGSGVVDSSYLYDDTEVMSGGSVINGGTLYNNAWVAGDAVVDGGSLGHASWIAGEMRVTSKAPRFLDLGNDYSVTIADDHMRVGQTCQTFEWWENHHAHLYETLPEHRTYCEVWWSRYGEVVISMMRAVIENDRRGRPNLQPGRDAPEELMIPTLW